MTPTVEQQAILDAVSGTNSNIMIRARAGCGKTATLKMIDAVGTQPYLLVCFNKAVADDAKAQIRPATTVKTFNGLGHGIWKDFCASKVILEKNKTRDIFKALADSVSRDERSFLWSQYETVIAGVNLARSIGYIPPQHHKAKKAIATYAQVEALLDETPSPEAKALIDKVLTTSIGQAYNGIIDFNDQVYMPALFGGNYPSFPVVLIDEYQDLSPVNRSMVAKLCKHSRQIGVGDEAQAIYGFRGADVDSMPLAIEQFSMDVLPLSVSFRCPSRITENVHWHVPDIQSATPGGNIYSASTHAIHVQPSTAVICRYNAPLCSLAMTMVMSGHHVNMSGVDIGARVIRQLTKLGSEDMTQSQVVAAIDEWEAEKESLDSKTAPDMAECMRVFAYKGKTLSQAIAYATHMFAASKGEIAFMSGHKAKGLEFEHVYHLDHEKIRREGQEANIHYVIDTRPSRSLTYIK